MKALQHIKNKRMHPVSNSSENMEDLSGRGSINEWCLMIAAAVLSLLIQNRAISTHNAIALADSCYFII